MRKVERSNRYKDQRPSVTEITDILEKDWMFWWIKNKGFEECEEIKQTSQNIGHGVHRGIEKFLRGKPFSQASEGLGNQQILMLSKLTEWCNDKKVKPLLVEGKLYSEEYDFAGTPDLIGTFNGGKTLTIVDWKTDSTPRDRTAERMRIAKYRYQAAGYSLLYEEKYDIKIGKAFIVRVTKDLPEPKFKVYKFTDIVSAQKLFLALRQIYKEIRGK